MSIISRHFGFKFIFYIYTIFFNLFQYFCETLFFFQLDCIQINTHTSLKALFLNFQTFFYRDTYRASRDTLLATVPVPMAPVPVDRINDNLTLTVSRQAIPHHRSIAVYVCSLQPAYSLHLFFSLRPSLPPHQKHTLSRLRDSNTFFRDLYFYFRKGLVNFAHVSLCIY